MAAYLFDLFFTLVDFSTGWGQRHLLGLRAEECRRGGRYR